MKRYVSALLAIALFLGFSPAAQAYVNTASTHLASASSQTWTIASGSQTGLQITSDMTMSVWFNPDSYDSSTNHVFFSRYNGSGLNGYEFYRKVGTDGLGFLTGSASAQHSVTISQSFTAGTWYNLVVTYVSASNAVNFYVNGTNVSSQTITAGGIGAQANNFYIGSNIGLGDYVDGYIDDARIWSRALSPTEVSAIASSPCTASNGASLQGWWKFDSDATDASGNSNTLSGVNSPTFSTSHFGYTCPVTSSFNFWQFFDF